jgi:hypothetical protein
MTREEELRVMLAQAIRYIERSIAHRGNMSMAQIEAELERVRKISVTNIAHNSSDVGVSFNLARARELCRKD